jgi:ankyrin repeat protein
VFNLLLTRVEPEVLATDVDNKQSLSLHHACSCKVEKVDMVERILQNLKFYDECKKTDLLKKALSQRNSRNKLPLHICIENSHVKLVELLIKYNADVNERGGNIDEHPIHMAAKIGSIEIMEILDQNGADLTVVNKKNENLLHIAAISNQFDFILKYFENEKIKDSPNYATVHATNLREQTPLLLAAANDNVESIDVLLKFNANIDDRDIEENSIFHLCAFYNNIGIFKYLLELPNFVSNEENLLSILKQTDKYDNTFVHIACKNNNLDILKFFFSSKLLDHLKAELVFAKNNYEQTGFHISCFEGHYEVVKFFLTIEIFNQSALIQDVDETFNTCLHLAAMKGHHRIVR